MPTQIDHKTYWELVRKPDDSRKQDIEIACQVAGKSIDQYYVDRSLVLEFIASHNDKLELDGKSNRLQEIDKEISYLYEKLESYTCKKESEIASLRDESLNIEHQQRRANQAYQNALAGLPMSEEERDQIAQLQQELLVAREPLPRLKNEADEASSYLRTVKSRVEKSKPSWRPPSPSDIEMIERAQIANDEARKKYESQVELADGLKLELSQIGERIPNQSI